ncbi:hypothetical protein [Flavivirga spongiicola]|uniref:Uncharacterized protein n=1 Tax=Flavivirga spongiicola TaxID=421621 RepID=A0ABU7XU33_9FLAO|nr:hypothetical protein [Flavivirga sp. MEBiC05379]MDO5979300.1 hypothetical protein [Flavivirga sp. MEBiC05379]
MPKKLVITCLINFLIAAIMGLVLRYTHINPMRFNYRFLTHAHSHIAMLGWVYLMLFTLIVHYFVPERKAIYSRLFWVTEFTVVGMMISFPLQGYAAVSISFSTLHIFCSYYFVYLIWKHQKTDSLVTRYLLKASLLFMLLSTVGVWCLGPAVSMLGQASAFYQIAIQFFLHFQFNGWFLLAVFAILFHVLKIQNSKEFKYFFRLLIGSTILTLALPVQWFVNHNALLYINGVGVFLQIMMLFFFLKLIIPKLRAIFIKQSKLINFTLGFAMFCFVLKTVLSLLSLFPEFSTVVYQHRNFIIGFIHLVMLGVISGFLFTYILQSQLITFNSTLNVGIITFILGFIFTELILGIQGALFYFGKGLLPNYYPLLFLSSLLLPIGLVFILINIIRTKRDVDLSFLRRQ